MKVLFAAAAGTLALALAAPASAADLAARPYTKAPPPMVATIYDWSGFYIGVNGGYGSAHTCADIVAIGAFPIVPAAADGCHNATGGTVGGQIGYRWQSANWVFGVEGQGNWADFTGRNIGLFTGTDNRSRIDAFGLITGQVGYAWNNVLLYVKGGAAVVGDRFDAYVPPGFVGAGTLLASSRDTARWGGTVGAGIEFGFAPNWSVGFEYDHIFLGHHDTVFTDRAGLSFATARIGQDVDMGLVRVNYRFGGPLIPRY
ncbi:outer membrane beta-barrel protein [Bradyrhizobium sp. RT10b]|uniref:outer membrane protein n=1 Tax=Bradyrhizobium sp. RT10b TaxID=3156331 RepID=UPI00339A0FA6